MTFLSPWLSQDSRSQAAPPHPARQPMKVPCDKSDGGCRHHVIPNADFREAHLFFAKLRECSTCALSSYLLEQSCLGKTISLEFTSFVIPLQVHCESTRAGILHPFLCQNKRLGRLASHCNHSHAKTLLPMFDFDIYVSSRLLRSSGVSFSCFRMF